MKKKVLKKKTLKVSATKKPLKKKTTKRKLSVATKKKPIRKVAKSTSKRKVVAKRKSPIKRKVVAKRKSPTKRKVVAKQKSKTKITAKPKSSIQTRKRVKTKNTSNQFSQPKGSFKPAIKPVTTTQRPVYDKNLSVKELFHAMHDQVVKEHQGIRNLEHHNHHPFGGHISSKKHGMQMQRIPRTIHRSRGR